MSSSKFFRLYRELDRSLPDVAPMDTSYEKERLEAFQNINLASLEAALAPFKSISKPVKPPKHHGKYIRIQHELNLGVQRKADYDKEMENRKKNKELKMIFEQNDLTNQIIKEIQQSTVGSNKKINDNLLKRMKKLESIDSPSSKTLSSSSSVSSTSGEKISSSLQATLDEIDGHKSKRNINPIPKQLPPLTTTLPVIPRLIDRGYSKLKWTNEERQKLHSLYQENPLPENKALMSYYYVSLADHFRVSFPDRKKEDVIEKIKMMIKKKQMKEIGEEKFWQIQKKS